jgi:hypothetical protein
VRFIWIMLGRDALNLLGLSRLARSVGPQSPRCADTRLANALVGRPAIPDRQGPMSPHRFSEKSAQQLNPTE